MKNILRTAAFVPLACFYAQQVYTLDDLQGAWWSDTNNPTADFAITDDRVWLDSDAQYHACSIMDDILVLELGPESGTVEQRIIKLDTTALVLENLITHETIVYTRVE